MKIVLSCQSCLVKNYASASEENIRDFDNYQKTVFVYALCTQCQNNGWK